MQRFWQKANSDWAHRGNVSRQGDCLFSNPRDRCGLCPGWHYHAIHQMIHPTSPKYSYVLYSSVERLDLRSQWRSRLTGWKLRWHPPIYKADRSLLSSRFGNSGLKNDTVCEGERQTLAKGGEVDCKLQRGSRESCCLLNSLLVGSGERGQAFYHNVIQLLTPTKHRRLLRSVWLFLSLISIWKFQKYIDYSRWPEETPRTDTINSKNKSAQLAVHGNPLRK